MPDKSDRNKEHSLCKKTNSAAVKRLKSQTHQIEVALQHNSRIMRKHVIILLENLPKQVIGRMRADQVNDGAEK